MVPVSKVIGLAASNIPIGAEGLALTNGLLSGVTVTGFDIGDVLYASPFSAGTYVSSTQSFPLSARTNEIGYVVSTGETTGKIYVNLFNEDSNLSLTTKERNLLEGNVMSTGTYEYTGMTKTSNTTFDIAPMKGWIVKNTLEFVDNPDVVHILFSGATGLTTPHLSSATSTYVLIDENVEVVLLSTEPTPQQRRENIYLGKVVHPDLINIQNIGNIVDFNLSPMSAVRDLFTPIKLINSDILPSPNGANLSFNTSSGILFGNGIGWVSNELNPNSVFISGQTPVTFQYRTSTGGTFSSTTVVDTLSYDVDGVVTVIPGNTGSQMIRATNQRVYLFPSGIIRLQYGQVWYETLSEAVAGLLNEPFEEYVNHAENGILIGIITVARECVDLTDSSSCLIARTSKFGELVGGTGGLSTTTLQQAYDNSTNPEIITNAILDGIQFQGGTGNDADANIIIENNSGVPTGSWLANGALSATTLSAVTISATTYLNLPVNSGDTANWNSAYNDTITGMTVTGTVVKTITLEQRDGGTVTADFTDISGGGGGSGDEITGATFNIGTGVLSLNTLSGSSITVDLDDRYSLSGHTHTVSEITDFPTNVSFFTNDSGYITGFTDTNDYVTGTTFNTGTGILEFTRVSGGTFNVDLDGRYLTGFTETPNTDDYLTDHTFNTSTGLFESTLQSGGTVSVNLDGRYLPISAYTDNDTNDYVTGVTFNTGDGVLSFTRLSGGTFNVDLDDRYSLTGHTHDFSEITNTGHTHDFSEITNTGHTHDFSEITNTGHTHTVSEITDFPTVVSYFTNDVGYLTAYTDTNIFVTGGTFNSEILEFTNTSGGTFNIDLSNTYSLTGHTHTISEITDFTDNSTNWDSAYDDTITGMTVTGIGTKTITLEQRDGGTITANFTDSTGGGGGETITGATFDTGTGDLDLTTNSGSTITANLDGRYSITGHTHTVSEITDFPTNISFFTNDVGYITGFTDTNDYVTSGAFNTGTGDLTLTRLSGGTVVTNFDNRYSLTGHTHSISDITDYTTPNLQEVTDIGNTTFNEIIANNFIASNGGNGAGGAIGFTAQSTGSTAHGILGITGGIESGYVSLRHQNNNKVIDISMAISPTTSGSSTITLPDTNTPFVLPAFFTDGITTVSANSTGLVNLSSLTEIGSFDDDYITGHTFNTSTGLFESTLQSGGTVSVNLDGRYTLTGNTAIPNEYVAVGTGTGIAGTSGLTYSTGTGNMTLSGGFITGGGSIINGKLTNETLRLTTTRLTGGTFTSWYDEAAIKGYFGFAATTNEIIYLVNQETGGTLNFGTSTRTNDFIIETDGQGTFQSNVTSSAFITSGGLSTQFVKGDGTLDSNSYSLTGHTHPEFSNFGDYLPLSGGTLTGPVTGTTFNVDNALLNYQENLDVDSAGSEVVATVSRLIYDAVFFDYVVKNGSNLRAGIVMATHDGTSVTYTDTSTADLGDTSGVIFTVNISGNDLRLIASVTTDNWVIKTLLRGI